MVEVSIVLGSASDEKIAERTTAVLKEHGITFDSSVISAHRKPFRSCAARSRETTTIRSRDARSTATSGKNHSHRA